MVAENTADFEGDTVFPEVDLAGFEAIDEREGVGDPPHRFVTWQR